MSDVIRFYTKNAADIADNVLGQSIGYYDQVLILGYDADGNADFRVSTGLAGGGDILWLIENFKSQLLAGDFSGGVK